MEREEENNTFEVRFLRNALPPQHEVQVEAVLLAIHSGTVALEHVPEEYAEAMLMEDIDVGAVTSAPRVRSPTRKGLAGVSIVTRERVTNNKYVAPPPSTYVRHRESLPMVPDPVLPDYLT